MNMRVDELFEGAQADQDHQLQPGGTGEPGAQREPSGIVNAAGGQAEPERPGGQGGAPGQGGVGEGGEPSPEQQQMYDRIVMAGIKVLNEMTDKIVQLLEQQADNLPKGVADTTIMIIKQLDEKAGGKVPRDVLFHAALEILENIVEFALQAGIGEVNKQTQNKAAQQLLIGLANNYGPEMTRFMEGALNMIQKMPKEEFGKAVGEQTGAEEQGGRAGAQASRKPGPPNTQAPQQPDQQQGLVARQMGR